MKVVALLMLLAVLLYVIVGWFSVYEDTVYLHKRKKRKRVDLDKLPKYLKM